MKKLLVSSTVAASLLFGSFTASIALADVKKVVVQEAKPFIHRSLGFVFTPPASWANKYVAEVKKPYAKEIKFYMEFRYITAKGQKGESLMILEAYDRATWNKIAAEEGPKPTILSSNDKYTFTASFPQDLPYTPNSVDAKLYTKMVSDVQGKKGFFKFAKQADFAVAEAKALVGTPYKEGGTTVKGFDASGFVRFVMTKMNVKTPPTAEAMSKIGKVVDAKQLQQGDLLFFKTDGSQKVNFVAIYAGGGKFVGATTNDGVSVESLNEDYWKKAFVAAKRVF